MMPMRDGIRLHTEVFLPPSAGPFPTVLMRTPYPDTTFPFAARPIDAFRSAGYTVVVQSCRGTWLSEGKFRFFQNEPEDGYDCIEQLAEQPWCTGRIGMYGSSYLGSVQWLAAKLRPPHLTCIAPQSPAAMFFYETPYVGGALFKQHLITWPRLVSATSWVEVGFDLNDFLSDRTPADHPILAALASSPNIDVIGKWHDGAMAEAMKEPLQHSTYDEWWERIMLTDEDSARIDIPVLAITGFHDGDQAGALYNWMHVERNELTTASTRHLLVGPWRHAQMRDGTAGPMGEVDFGSDASVPLTEEIIRFFDVHLKQDASVAQRPRCRLFTSGSNQWRTTSAYPPVESADTALYFSSDGRANSLFGNGRLAWDAPGEEFGDLLPADWRTPVPLVAVGEDCRQQSTRHDVLVYTSEVLSEDVTVLGQVRANIYLSADVPDADIVVRLEDVLPDGRSLNMTAELGAAPFRARYRKGFDQEVLLTPGEPDLLPFHVCHMGHTFLAGHRIRVSLSATAHPAIEPNHHTGEPVASAVDRRTAVETIYHDAEHPSHLVLPVFRVASSGA